MKSHCALVWKALERRGLERDSIPSWSRRSNPLMTNASTPGAIGGYINTPTVAEEEGEEVDTCEGHPDNAMNGKLVGEMEILEKEEPSSRKMIRRQKQEDRLERRYRRAVRLNQSRKNDSRSGFANNDPLSGTNLIRARPARPCSYCHVPYHHKFAPFSNMKLVPW